MFALDLFNTKYEKSLQEGATDNTTEHLLKPLHLRAANILTQLRSGHTTPEKVAALTKEYEDLVAERMSILKGEHPEATNEMGYGGVVGEGEVTPTATGLKHHAKPGNYGGYEPEPELKGLNKTLTKNLKKGMGVEFKRAKKFGGGIEVDETGIPGNVPANKIPGKADLLKGKGRQTYEAQDQKKNSEEVNESQRLHQGDPIVVTGPNEFEGKTGEIEDFSPSGKFVVVDLYNHGRHSMHLSDVEYNQYADTQADEDDWYDDADEFGKPGSEFFPEGFQDFNKVEPYAVCLAGKPVKKFDYYEDARQFHDNWKKKLYREGNKAKADKITLMPLNLDEGDDLGNLDAEVFGRIDKEKQRRADLKKNDPAAYAKEMEKDSKNYGRGIMGALRRKYDQPLDEQGDNDTYDIIRTNDYGKKDFFAGNYSLEQAKDELAKCLAHPLHTKYGHKFAIVKRNEQPIKEFAPGGIYKPPVIPREPGKGPFEDDGRSTTVSKVQQLLDAGKSVFVLLPGAKGRAVGTQVGNDHSWLNVQYKGWKDPKTRSRSRLTVNLNADDDASLKLTPGSQFTDNKDRPFDYTLSGEAKTSGRGLWEQGVAEGSTTRGGFGGSASQAYHEIEWLKKKIASLPPTKEKQIRDLQRQIRERELAIAFQKEGVAEGYTPDTNYSYTIVGNGDESKAYDSKEEARGAVRKLGAGYKIKRKPRTSARSVKKHFSNRNIDEESSTSSEAVEIALIRRVLVAHTDLIMNFGLDKVTQAIEEVAYNVGDVDEIGTSDVSGWIHQVKQILGVE